MSIKSAPYFWVECDGCGVKSTNGDDGAAWADEGDARKQVFGYGDWQRDDQDGHFCHNCQSECPVCEVWCMPKTMTTCADCHGTRKVHPDDTTVT